MKKIILSISLCSIALFSTSQDYYHGIGGQINFGLFSSPDDVSAASVPGIFYKATLMVTDNRGPNFAVSAYPNLGLNVSVQSNEGASGGFAAGIPVVGELYLGDADDACFFVGAGLDYSLIASSDTYGNSSGAIFGPHVGLGGQFNFQDRLIGVRAGYTYGVNRPTFVNQFTNQEYRINKMLFTLGVYYLFGN